MGTSFQKIACMALLLGLAAACSTDSTGSTDNEDCDENEALDAAGNGSDGAACTCTPTELVPGSSTRAGKVDLDCYCRAYGCLSYEQSTACKGAGLGPSVSNYAGCNMVSVDSGGGYTGQTFTYDATCHKLLGAYSFSDIATLDCSGEKVHAIVAGVNAFRDFADCEQGEPMRVCQ
jgi:hypothetical protein